MSRGRTSISTSVRRYFIDKFFFSKEYLFTKGSRIIDIGGKKKKKRGLFNIDSYGAEVTYVNIDKEMEPDILAYAEAIPVDNNSYDIAIMGEVLEHVPDPRLLMKEAYRILKPGGKLIATIPFMIPVHADPHDFGRYTGTFWQQNAQTIGYREIEITNHGTMYAVLAYMLQQFFNSRTPQQMKRMYMRIIRKLIEYPLIYFLLRIDEKTEVPLIKAWTTGYGIVLTK